MIKFLKRLFTKTPHKPKFKVGDILVEKGLREEWEMTVMEIKDVGVKSYRYKHLSIEDRKITHGNLYNMDIEYFDKFYKLKEQSK